MSYVNARYNLHVKNFFFKWYVSIMMYLWMYLITLRTTRLATTTSIIIKLLTRTILRQLKLLNWKSKPLSQQSILNWTCYFNNCDIFCLSKYLLSERYNKNKNIIRIQEQYKKNFAVSKVNKIYKGNNFLGRIKIILFQIRIMTSVKEEFFTWISRKTN